MNIEEIHAFKIKIHPLRSLDFLRIIDDAIKNNRQIVQSGINAASILELKNNLDLAEAYNNSDLINIDGMSVVWALRFLGYKVPERVACPDLALKVIDMAERNNYSIFLFGAKEANLKAAVQNLKISYSNLNIAGYINGYFQQKDELAIVQYINNSNSDILFLGMPSPQKEFFVEKYKYQLKTKYILGTGGFFDILAGSLKRAPVWMQKIGMEWFFRFIQEPRRMWYRYFNGNIKFIWLVLCEKLKNQNRNLE